MANFKQTSRYRNATLYKNRSGKNVITLRSQLNLQPGDRDKFLTVTQEILQRPDTISQKAYNTPEFWWVIYEFNGVKDPLFELKLGDILRIPPIDKVKIAVASLEG
jgi:hypothetical protein